MSEWTSDILSGRPQVCDRCRQRKIKCDGQRPKCDKCRTANVPCIKSAQLTRRTKPRGYVEPTEELIQALRRELGIVKTRLKASSEREQSLRLEVLQKEDEVERYRRLHELPQLQLSGETPKQHEISPEPGKGAFLSAENLLLKPIRPRGPVIKHLGRLVHEDGQEFFAGSPTGIHFIVSAQTQFQELFGSDIGFPEWMFRLHLLHIWIYPKQLPPSIDHYKPVLDRPIQAYRDQFFKFVQRWAQLYPILLPDRFLADIDQVISKYQLEQALQYDSLSLIFQIYAIMAINHLEKVIDASMEDETLPSPSDCENVLSSMFFPIASHGTVETLQALLLYVIYLQLTKRHRLSIQVNGMCVKLAQSLGIHRNSRRFKHSALDVELRKRLWWCVFIMDVNTSVHHGLPRSIKAADVSDFLVDIDSPDMSVQKLPLPVPGRLDRLGNFFHHIQISQIICKTVDQLYITFDRRGGPEKIHELEQALYMWTQVLPPRTVETHETEANIFAESSTDSVGTASVPTTSSEIYDKFTLDYLHVLGHMARLLIHLPGLTFEKSEPQFRISLQYCCEASRAIISALYSADSGQRLLIQWPCGLHILIISATMLIYSQWVAISQHWGQNGKDDITESIQHVMAVISRLEPINPPQPINEIVTFLAFLLRKTLPIGSALTGADLAEREQGTAVEGSISHIISAEEMNSLHSFAVDPANHESPFWFPGDLEAWNNMQMSTGLSPDSYEY